jgi:hypothetical protein
MNIFLKKPFLFIQIILVITGIIACNSDKKNIPAELKQKKDSISDFSGYNTSEILTPELINAAINTENQITVRVDQDINNKSYRTSSSIAEIKDGKYQTIKLFIRSGKKEETENLFNSAKESASGFGRKPPETIDKLGDRSFWSGSPAEQLNILKENNWVIITMSLRDNSLNDEIVMEDAKKIAELVLKKM